MADNEITQDNNGKYALGGAKDVDLEGVNASKYAVYTTDKNLQAAKDKYPAYDWFACFSVKDKATGNYANVSYTIKFDKPAAGKKLYYFLNNTANEVSISDTDDKNNKKRVKATLTVGDPPVGLG